MSDHPTTESGDESNPDSTVDAVAAVVLVLLAVAFCLYLVSNL